MEVMKKHHVPSYASYCYTEMASLTFFTTPEIDHKQGEPMEEYVTGTSWIYQSRTLDFASGWKGLSC